MSFIFSSIRILSKLERLLLLEPFMLAYFSKGMNPKRAPKVALSVRLNAYFAINLYFSCKMFSGVKGYGKQDASMSQRKKEKQS